MLEMSCVSVNVVFVFVCVFVPFAQELNGMYEEGCLHYTGP